MKDKLSDFFYHFLLVVFLWGLSFLIYLEIEEPQIVVIFHPYPESVHLLPRSNIFHITLAFSFIIFYNYLFALFGLDKKLINKVNTLFFIIGLIGLIYLFYLNY
jgi:hypothetical protein